MHRNPTFFLRIVFFSFCCFNFSVVFAQTDDRADLTGNYAGALRFPSAKLNGKATLNVEGDKFRLRDANGREKTGRITAIKTGGDYDSIALMFDETPTANQPFTHSMMSLRLRKTGKTFIFTSAPGEEREFRLVAVSENARIIDRKLTDAGFDSQTEAVCENSKSSKCGVNFGFIAADDVKTEIKAGGKTTTSPKTAAKKPTAKPTAKKAVSKSVVSKSRAKKEPAKSAEPIERAKSPKPAQPKPSPSPTPNAKNADVGKSPK